MNIIALADIHGCLDYIGAIARRLSEADIVLVAGDITNFGGETQARQVIGALEEHNPNILAVHGNCDLPTVEEYLCTCEIALDRRCVTLNGLAFAGIGGSLPCPGHTPNESGEEILAERLARLKEMIGAAFVFVSHQPAWGTTVDAAAARHTGSRAIRQFILETQPILAVSGHIHEAVGTDKLANTVLINPGPFRYGHYGVIEVEGGEVRNAQVCEI
ncbi:MAG: metallophosphoesterase family protein [Phycisphaerae bacterium]|nr:metallophosphoesterase family protein [Phycisphaerae bacterium]